MKFQVIRPFSVSVKGRRTEYKMGQRISEAAYRRLTKTQQGRFLSARAAAGRVPYTREEVLCIVKAYLQNDNRLFVREAFQQQFPNSKLVRYSHRQNFVPLWYQTFLNLP